MDYNNLSKMVASTSRNVVSYIAILFVLIMGQTTYGEAV
jgi:hypothetical protein